MRSGSPAYLKKSRGKRKKPPKMKVLKLKKMTRNWVSVPYSETFPVLSLTLTDGIPHCSSGLQSVVEYRNLFLSNRL